MGTLVRIKLYAHNQQEALSSFHAAFERIAEIDNALSDYKPESELNQVAVTAVQHPVKIGADLYRVLAAAQELAHATNGAFDVTLGPLTHLWRKARAQHHVPAEADVRSALSRSGYRKLHLNDEGQTLELDLPGMQLDVGGIAKGYAADEALGVLRRKGILSALVAASGDLAFSDSPPGQRGWKIGIDSFDQANVPFTRVLQLHNAAVSTSGDMEQHLDVNGTRYSHIVQPRTGMGLTTGMTVTIVARKGIDADAMATAVSVLGAEKGLTFVEARPDVAALLLTRRKDGTRVLESHRFTRLAVVH